MVFLKEFFEKVDFEKEKTDNKKEHENYPGVGDIKVLYNITIFNVKSDNMFSEIMIILNFLLFQNDIADLVTDGLRVQRCHVKELKNKRKVSLSVRN